MTSTGAFEHGRKWKKKSGKRLDRLVRHKASRFRLKIGMLFRNYVKMK